MRNYEQMPLGKGLEAVSLRVTELQREVHALRRDVKLILHLLGESKSREKPDERDVREGE